ncbi:MAG: nucleoside-diphosphate sugar epimerase [Herbinix sp.]|jgi:FlaA1/EpsC-like NDP-sugar epimerase|nr:nucleoside-diphosphate sugar epimerase [Herbinix sp.]
MTIRKYRKEVVFLLDITIIALISSVLYFILPGGIEGGRNDFIIIIPHLILFILCTAVSLYLFKVYDNLWRYAESGEYLKLILGGFVGYIVFFLIENVYLLGIVPFMYSLAASSASMLCMLSMRLCYRLYRRWYTNKGNENKTPLVIIGAGNFGVRLQEELENNPNSKYKVSCFLDDNIEKIGMLIHNIEVKGPISNMEKLLKNNPVSEVVVAIPSISQVKRREIFEVCSKLKYRVRTLPDTLTLLQNEGNYSLWNNIRDVKMEDLLGREQAVFDNEGVENFIKNKTVMVTGGGGSIGSELCRQIAELKPKKLVIVDIYENSAYEIQQELLRIYGKKLNLRLEIASVREKDKVNQLFHRYRPQIIFHAAAHKHVPLMERCPEEAIKNNIFGTYHVIQAASRYKAEKFILISTDKAVNPTNIMGASKRFCEMIVQSMKKNSKTKFAAVRFGNVLGSNGSVIPLFQKQIAMGGPVTITDKRIVRYFMTITEAAQLVLQAGAMANSAEIFVLDMGQPVKIINLAENLIHLAGRLPYTEIPIIETGLRPGEKLYEELLMKNNGELIMTQNHKIFIERQEEISQKEMKKKLNIIRSSLNSKSQIKIKDALKQVVPTYRDPEEVNADAIRTQEIGTISENEKVYRMNVC